MKRDETKDQHPYLNAKRGRDKAYRSGTWHEDDRRMILLIKGAFLGVCFLIITQVIIWIV
jgi:hypothetical protein